ncbi:glycosyltransferase family 39 protein [Rhodococcus sp. D2-41]|uniref:ArnT family glycosyltransferase n=1 Tax=Speluncibacter jeojiensis TaxID=2710754 RepID=UPI00240EDE36|nr:glycosyltransferase family 39 protein [Rhodococcus sp. D2-41]MDG3010071.1 glycosyltransferase family 39 protein [Rhodococcus sp. D2-41]
MVDLLTPARTSETPATRSSPERPRFVRPALLVLLAGTAVLYCWGLSRSGWANDFYAAAVQSGTQSWKAWLFGSLDPGNAITVDKPPAALWVMGLSGRIFGFSPWSMLVPQALMGVGSVAFLYGAVRRWSGPVAGLLAGTLLALTPVAAVMFRFNNPDALLVFLMVVAAYCVVRATESGSGRWLALAGTLVGFAFLTKLLQAFLVLPAFGLVFLVAAPGGFWKRIGKLLGACAAMIVAGGWFIALVSLWPTGSRPYIGGSTDNSLLQLALGYNGLGRVLGGDGNMGGGAGNAMFGGQTGLTRLFGQSMGTEISWLLPAALIALVAGLWFTRRTPRTGRTRAALILWGGWTVVTGLVFSFMAGTIHPYYTVALAPGIAALVAISVCELWRGRHHTPARIVLGLMIAATGTWGFILLDRTPDWMPALRWIVVAGCVVVAAAVVVGVHQFRRGAVVVAIAGLVFGLAGTAAYTIVTVTVPHSGAIPTAGPRSDGPGGMSGPPGLGGAADNAALQDLISDTGTRWAAATIGSQGASSLELKTGASVMAIGGFTGSDDSPTLSQFQEYVADKQIRYFIGGGRMGPMGGRGVGAEIDQWVQANFTPINLGDTTIYDLSAPR